MVQVDFLSPGYRADPYAVFAQARANGPVYVTDRPGLYGLILDWATCDAVLRDNRHFGRPRADSELNTEERAWLYANMSQEAAQVWSVAQHMMLFRNPPAHTRLRGLVSKAFTPKAIGRLEPLIAGWIDELLGAAEADGAFDFMTAFAFPLPIRVIAHLLGVPTKDHAQFRQWSEHFLGLNDFIPATPAQAAKTAESSTATAMYLMQNIAEKRENPDDDILSALVAAEDGGERLSSEELLATAMMILIAGYETTSNLLGNGMLNMMRRRDQWEALRANPALAASAVEEIVRYESPVHITGRMILEPTTLHGHALPQWQEVGVVLASANRDPKRFRNPDVFDIARSDGPSLGFGAGIHFCIGAPLARLEGAMALAALAKRFPNLRLADEAAAPVWRPTVALRGLKTLPMVVE